MNRPGVVIDGVPLWTPTRTEMLDAMSTELARPRGSPVRLFTLNPEIMMLAYRDASYRHILAGAEWNVVDGIGVALAVRLRTGRPAVRHPGADLIFDLARVAQQARRPLLIVGGVPSRLEKACRRLRELFPNLAVDGVSPSFDPATAASEESTLEARLLQLRPGVVVVCMGAPKQERWAEHWLGRLAHADVRIIAGLGGTVDFLSGEVRRAPSLLRRLGGEWLFRLVVEPWRWRRQLSTIPTFAVRTLISTLVSRGAPEAPLEPMRRVVVYAHYMPPHPSASATRMMSLARYLRDDGCDVTLLTTAPGPDQFEGIRIERPLGRVGLARWLARNPRCPILVSSPPATPAAEVALISRALGYRVVVDIRDPYVSEALSTGDLRRGVKSWAKRRLERRLLTTGHETSFVSRPLLETMGRLMAVDLSRAVIAPNGVDTELFSRDAHARDELRREHRIGEAPVFVYSGILGGKELDKVMTALADPLRRGAFMFLLAVVDEHSRPLAETLKGQARDLAIAERIIWVENVPLREVARYLSAADIGINPLPLSRTYCLPVKTFEYLACGVHNLAFGNAAGALADVLTDPRAGSLVTTWDAFSQAATQLCASLDAVRAGVPARRELARAHDRNDANAVLRELLLGRASVIEDATDAAA